jgi:SanA protein
MALRRLAVIALSGTLLAGGWLTVEAARLPADVQSWIFDDIAAVPVNDVGLLLGCAPMLGHGRPNPFFTARVHAAADLFAAGRIRFVLASGDNGTVAYNEPARLRDALIAAGVPADRIILDHAGFRTLDSVVRARDVFGQQRFTVISQRFHNERAVFLARERGIEAVAYDAPEVGGLDGFKVKVREALARVRAVLDVRVLKTQPRFLGPSVSIGAPSA